MMQQTSRTKKGFTLIEVLIALTIFVVFVTSMSSAYLYIARSQRETNNMREMYSELRHIIALISDEARMKTIDYQCYTVKEMEEVEKGMFEGELTRREIPPSSVCGALSTRDNTSYLALIDSSLKNRTIFRIENTDDGKVLQIYKEQNTGVTWEPDDNYTGGVYRDIKLHNIKLNDLKFEISPLGDPFDPDNVSCGPLQFQPSASIYISVSGLAQDTKDINLNLQTSISSRIYNLKTNL
jgi:prepilin-type N-terminal cleavage/methylation domain-containing protein